MYYPWLDVPFITAPIVIAIVATLHVFISHYAVGGGILLALENARALRDGDAAYRNYWKKHAKFFILLTVVLGAITGVGIWSTIGLASPLATEILIRIFVFGWAIEWCFFILEIVAGFVFYYFWDKLSPKRHVAAGAIYAAAAWISLVLITGITAFMLNSSGLFGDWARTGSFWDAFFNVQFLPQTVVRTGCALTLGAMYVLLHASIFEKDLDVREKVTRRMRFPAFIGIVLLVAGVVGWAFFLPESSLATLERAAAANVLGGLFVAIIAGIVLLLLVGPVAKPRETSPGLALGLFLLGIAGIAVGEFVREAVRKPFIVDRVVLGNQIYRDDVARLRENGLLYSGVWTRLYLDEFQEKYPDLKISAKNYLGWEPTRPKYWNEIEKSAPKTDDSAPVESKNPPQNAQIPNDSAASTVRGSLFVRETAAQASGTRLRGGVLRSDNAPAPIPLTPTAGTSNPRPAFAPTSTPSNLPTSISLTPTENAAFPAPVLADVSPSTAAPAPAPAQTPAPIPVAEPIPAAVEPAPQPVASPEPERPEPAPAPVAAEPEIPADAPTETEIEPDADPLAARDLQLNGPIGEGNRDLLKLEPEDRLALGRAVFLHHCNDCHAGARGYSAVGPLVAGRTRAELKEFALRLNRPSFYMPPWCGTEVEAELLAEYLESIAPKFPANVYRKTPEKSKKSAKTDAPKEESPETPESSASDAATK